MSRRLRIIIAVVGLSLMLGACGSHKAAETTGPTDSPTVETCRWMARLEAAGVLAADRTHQFAIGDGHTEDDAVALVAAATLFCPEAVR